MKNLVFYMILFVAIMFAVSFFPEQGNSQPTPDVIKTEPLVVKEVVPEPNIEMDQSTFESVLYGFGKIEGRPDDVVKTFNYRYVNVEKSSTVPVQYEGHIQGEIDPAKAVISYFDTYVTIDLPPAEVTYKIDSVEIISKGLLDWTVKQAVERFGIATMDSLMKVDAKKHLVKTNKNPFAIGSARITAMQKIETSLLDKMKKAGDRRRIVFY